MRISDWSSDVCSSDLVALVLQPDAADQVGRVLLAGQPARGLRRGTALREHEHRGTARGGAGERIGVDRHEQVRLVLARQLVAARKRNEDVVVAGQGGLEARRGIDLPGTVAGARKEV